MNVQLRKPIFLLLFLAVLSILPNRASGTNKVMGGYITYNHSSAKTYTVYLTYWASCSETLYDTSYLRIEDLQTGNLLDSIKPNQYLYKKNISNFNQSCQGRILCNGFGNAPGVYEVRWEYSIDFSAYSACEFELSSTMIRSSTITTGSSNSAFFIASNINLCYDSLPRSFLKFSQAEMLIPRDAIYTDNGDYRDTMNYFDSFSYALVPARTNKTTSITYQGFLGIDYQWPIRWFGAPGKTYAWPATIQMFPETGNFRLTSVGQNAVSVVCYEVQGWKRVNDTMRLLGSVVTDEALVSLDQYATNAQRIYIDGIVDVLPICAGSTGFMDVVIRSNNNDTVEFSLENHAGWDMRVDTLEHVPDYIKLRVWIDSDTPMIRTMPYFFTVRARNFGCSYYTQSVQKGGFKIVDGSAYDKTSLHYADNQRYCNENLLIASDSIYPSNTFTWIIGLNATEGDSLYVADSAAWNVYYLQEKLVGCARSIVDSFYIDSIYHPVLKLLSPDKYCAGDTASVQVNYSGGLPVSSYLWQDSSTANSHKKPLLADEKFGLRLIDAGNCVSYDSLFVRAIKLNNPNADLDLCWERRFREITIYERAIITGAVLPITIKYYSLLGYSSDSIIRPIRDQQVGLHYEDSLGCQVNDTVTVNFRSGYGPLFLSPLEDTLTRCGNQEVLIELNDLNGNSGVKLTISGAGKTGKSFTIIPVDSMEIIASGSLNGTRCRGFNKKWIFVNPKSTVSIGNIDGFCGDSSLLLDLGPYATPSTGTWSGEGIFKQGATYYYHSDSASNGKQTLRYSLKHPTSPCVTKDSIEFDKNEPIQLDFSPNHVSGYRPLIISFATQVSGGANIQYLWDFGDGGSNTQKNPAYQYTDTGLFSVKVTATGKYCAASILKSDLIHVIEKPSSVSPKIQNENRMVYPNPGNATFTIAGPIFAVACINSLGQKMNLELVNTSEEQTSYSILSGVPGVYYIKVQTENSSQIIRYVILE